MHTLTPSGGTTLLRLLYSPYGGPRCFVYCTSAGDHAASSTVLTLWGTTLLRLLYICGDHAASSTVHLRDHITHMHFRSYPSPFTSVTSPICTSALTHHLLDPLHHPYALPLLPVLMRLRQVQPHAYRTVTRPCAPSLIARLDHSSCTPL